jgi:hypothetical protein
MNYDSSPKTPKPAARGNYCEKKAKAVEEILDGRVKPIALPLPVIPVVVKREEVLPGPAKPLVPQGFHVQTAPIGGGTYQKPERHKICGTRLNQSGYCFKCRRFTR